MNRSIVIAVVAVAVVVLAAPAFAAKQAPQGALLTSSLAVGADQRERPDDISITFSLTNEGVSSARMLRWQTPLDGIEADIFEVTLDGEPVPYIGKLIKRAAPVAADFIEIQPGETVSTVIDLSAVYDMSRRGEYAVRFRGAIEEAAGPQPLDAPAEGTAPQSRGIESNEVRLWIEGSESPFSLDVSALYLGGTTNCTNSQKTTLTTAVTNATSISTKAYNYLVSNGNSTLYRYWFGAYTSSRLSTVKSHYSSLKDALGNKSITIDCGCTGNYYAYVYPTQPYKIYVCKAFWSAPAKGRDSKAGTLVHETSHFNVVAKTQDYVYGATGAHDLALSSPTKAIANADNHEYFAEDQP